MSGTIAVTPDLRWSAANWLFDWTLDFLAAQVDDEAAKGEIREIVDDNIGWLGVEDFPEGVRGQLLDALKNRLVPAADDGLPATVDNREDSLSLLGELSELASRIE
jgi:hypothetical protein